MTIGIGGSSAEIELAKLFDMTTEVEAISLVDSAIKRLNGIFVDIWSKAAKITSTWTKDSKITSIWTKTPKT